MATDPVQALEDPRGLEDPYPVYRLLREGAPAAWAPFESGGGHWFVTRYDLVDRILRDPRIWKDAQKMGYEGGGALFRTMLFKDPPDHNRLRGLVNRAFTQAMVDRKAPMVRTIVDDMMDQVAEAGRVNFVEAVAAPLPVAVIATLLGVPRSDMTLFRTWSRQIVGTQDDGQDPDEMVGEAAISNLTDYFDRLLKEKAAHPEDDLLSGLATVEAAGDRLSREELLGMSILLLVAGHETTVNLLSNGLHALLEHPDQMARLRRDPSLVAPAVEEMLRFDAPVQCGTFRFVGEAFAFEGIPFPAGTTVEAIMGAANRDPNAFPDPDRFDVGRNPNAHLSFGRGVHFCLGAPLARLEAHTAFGALLGRFGRIEPDGQAVRKPNAMFRGFDVLPVRVT